MEDFKKIDLIKWSEGRFIGVDYDSLLIHMIYDASSTGLFIKASFSLQNIRILRIGSGRQNLVLNIILNLLGSFSILTGPPILIFNMNNGEKYKIELTGIKRNDFRNLRSEVNKLNQRIKAFNN